MGADDAAETGRRRRVLTAGDAEGKIAQLFQQVENQQKRVGAFDVLFSVGGFLPSLGPEAKDRAAVLAEYVAGKRAAPLETYFIESSSTALIQAAPEGKELFKGVHFLGGFGVRQIHGLRIAFLSGRYDPAVYQEQEREAAGAAFVGPAFTPHAIQGLIRLAQQPGAPPVDLLLTADWPRGLGERLDEVDQPKHPDGAPVKWHEVTAPPIAELCEALEPRYHVFAGMDIFYQRPPFQTRRSGHVCRLIALGKVGSKGKGRAWVHGLQLSPAVEMTSTALMQRPENTTPCPFLPPAPAADASGAGAVDGGTSLKRCAAELERPDGGQDESAHVMPDQVFLSRLPPFIEERRLEAALKHVGTILRVHLAREDGAEGRPCRGFGWVTFSSPEEAQAACDLSDMLECGGRKIGICPSRQGRRDMAKRHEAQILIEPHADCWFCLVNPKVEKHMIVTASTEVYVAVAKGPVHSTHVLVLPVKHAPCFAACPPDLQQAIQAHICAIRRMCRYAGQEILVWERWVPMASSAANHMQVQVVPIDRGQAVRAHEALLEVADKHLHGSALQPIGSHGDVAEHLHDDASTPYIYFEVPGHCHAGEEDVRRYVYAGIPGGPRIPVNLGRIFTCHLLGCEEKLDWRQCQEDRAVEKGLAQAFRESFLPFQPEAK